MDILRFYDKKDNDYFNETISDLSDAGFLFDSFYERNGGECYIGERGDEAAFNIYEKRNDAGYISRYELHMTKKGKSVTKIYRRRDFRSDSEADYAYAVNQTLATIANRLREFYKI